MYESSRVNEGRDTDARQYYETNITTLKTYPEQKNH